MFYTTRVAYASRARFSSLPTTTGERPFLLLFSTFHTSRFVSSLVFLFSSHPSTSFHPPFPSTPTPTPAFRPFPSERKKSTFPLVFSPPSSPLNAFPSFSFSSTHLSPFSGFLFCSQAHQRLNLPPNSNSCISQLITCVFRNCSSHFSI